MAAIKFLYRSTRDIGPITLRLSFRNNSKDHVIESKTQITCKKQEWNLMQNSRRIKDGKLKNKKIEIDKELLNIERHVLTAFNNSASLSINKKWLNEQLDNYYGRNITEVISDKILDHFERYLSEIKNNITRTTYNRYKSGYHFTKKFISECDYYDENSKICEIDIRFYDAFKSFGEENDYSISTINKYFGIVKSMCNHAFAHHGIALSHKYQLIKLKNEQTPVVYLTMDELKTIAALDSEQLGSRLDNVRDWLLISCLTGQRISDFMNFNPENIRIVGGTKVMDIFQQKGKKSVTIPILERVSEIIKKYNGNFPKKISDQKYNDYVKEVVKIAGINDTIKGGSIKVIPGKGKRKVIGEYPKYELISSHVGRRSFATNFYGKMGTPLLMNITGHAKESTFLSYIGKTSKDTAIEAAREFQKLNIEL